jgi:hypothetical protein
LPGLQEVPEGHPRGTENQEEKEGHEGREVTRPF